MKVFDSHIHILSLKNQAILKWHGDHPLNKQCRLEEYLEQSQDDRFEIVGIVAIEFDPVVEMSTLAGCLGGIEEYHYFSRVINGTLAEDEGSNDYKHLLKAVVPWAPIPNGPEFLSRYVDQMAPSNTFGFIKGFRYLVQDKPLGTMLGSGFIESLKWLESHDYVFDWGIDLRSGGSWQFEESLEVFRQVPNVKYIINHLTKPSYRPQDLQAWKGYMDEIYRLTPNSYMKLSGGFSELPNDVLQDTEKCTELIFPWFEVCFKLWGADRMIWASNWPVCAIYRGPSLVSQWYTITEKLFDKIDLKIDNRNKIYYSNCFAAYNIR